MYPCDTGSTDGTVAAAEAFASEHGEPEKLIIGHFEWCDDFAAARNYADSLSTGEWRAYMDCDERLQGGACLREALASLVPSVLEVSLRGYAKQGSTRQEGKPTSIKVIVRGPRRWVGRLHEHLLRRPIVVQAPTLDWRQCCWHHVVESDRRPKRERNIRVARKWVADEPENANAWTCLCEALLAHAGAVEGTSPEEMQICRVEGCDIAQSGLLLHPSAWGLHLLGAAALASAGHAEQALAMVGDGLAIDAPVYTFRPHAVGERLYALRSALIDANPAMVSDAAMSMI